jgi:hypothetical protein
MSRDRPAFSRDSDRESYVAEFLNSHLYEIYFDKSERITDKKRQLSGVDIVCRHGEIQGELLIDEKAATSWAHREIGTFAFELSFLLGDREIEGWFLEKDRKSETTHWLCVWPRTSGGEINSDADIVSAEVVLIECKSLRRWARRIAGKSTIYLEECIQKLRNSSEIREIEWAGLRVIISRNLPEQPINLLVPKEILRTLSGDFYWDLSC